VKDKYLKGEILDLQADSPVAVMSDKTA
jgi:hypothetical protein